MVSNTMLAHLFLDPFSTELILYTLHHDLQNLFLQFRIKVLCSPEQI